MFAKEIIYAGHNMILMKVDDELLYKIFWEHTARFDYELRIRINDRQPNIEYIDFYKDFIVIATDEEDEDKIKNPRIELIINLVWKVDSFNRLKNARTDEITQIYEVWVEDKDNKMKLLESNFDIEARRELFKIHFEIPDDSVKLLTDSDTISSTKIIDVEFNEINDKQLKMNDEGH